MRHSVHSARHQRPAPSGTRCPELGAGEQSEDTMCCDAQARDDPVMVATMVTGVWNRAYLEKLIDILFLSVFLGSSFNCFPGVPEGHTISE